MVVDDSWSYGSAAAHRPFRRCRAIHCRITPARLHAYYSWRGCRLSAQLRQTTAGDANSRSTRFLDPGPSRTRSRGGAKLRVCRFVLPIRPCFVAWPTFSSVLDTPRCRRPRRRSTSSRQPPNAPEPAMTRSARRRRHSARTCRSVAVADPPRKPRMSARTRSAEINSGAGAASRTPGSLSHNPARARR